MRSLFFALVLLLPLYARANQREIDDLKRSIETHRGSVSDLDRQDARRSVTDEITLLRAWVDEAANLLGQEKLDRVREVLDRLNAQESLIRQKIAAATLMAQAQEREAALKSLREKIERTRNELQQQIITKKAMEMNAK